MKEVAIGASEQVGRNGVIIPDIGPCQERGSSNVEALFFWLQKLVRHNTEEKGRTPPDAQMLIPGTTGTSKDHATIVRRSFEGPQYTVDDQNGRGRAKVSPAEVYTVSMLGDTGVVPAPVLRVSRCDVTQSGQVGLYDLVSNEPKASVLTDEGWVTVSGDHLQQIQEGNPMRSSLEPEARDTLTAQDDLVRSTLANFAEYIKS